MSVVDKNSKKYPSTIEFASGESENRSKVSAGAAARRPGGSYRGAKHGFHTVKCTCAKHPCTCGTEAAAKAKMHDNVNVC